MPAGHVVVLILLPFCLGSEPNNTTDAEKETTSVKDCGNPNTVDHASSRTTNGTQINSIVTYQCHEGFTLSNGQTLRCDENGMWNGSMPTCNPIDCGNPNTVDHASKVTINGTQINSIVTYLCDRGFTPSYGQTLRCDENGNWTGSMPTCNPINCSSPKHVEHSSFHTPIDTRFNSIVTYQCNEGYLPTTKQTLRCVENGTWIGSLPTCNPEDCRNPPNVTNGSVSLINQSTTYLSQASYTCDNGFVIYGGNNPIQCQANGRWDENTPSCWKTSIGYNETCVGLNFTKECATRNTECRQGISRRQSDLRCLCIPMFEFDQYNNYCRPTLPENIQCSVVDVSENSIKVELFPKCTTGSNSLHFSTYIIHFNQSRYEEARVTCQNPKKTFSSLTPASPYMVQVQVEEGGLRSQEVECASDYTRPSAPDFLSVTDIDESSFSVSWGYTSYKPPQGFLYRLTVGTTEQPITTPNNSHVVSNLRSNTSYTVTVTGIINGTMESAAKSSSACTLPDPPNIIFNGEMREDNGVSLNVSADAGIVRIFIAGKQCDVRSYGRYWIISGLGQGQSYDITAQTYTHTCNKWSRNGPTITVSTRPGEPTNLVIHNKTETTLCVQWGPPSSGGVDNYIVKLKQEDIKTKSNDTSYCFNSLDPGSGYKVIVRSEWNKLKSLDVTQLDTSTVPLAPAVTIRHVAERGATVHVASYNKSLSCELVLDNRTPIQWTGFQQQHITHQSLLPGTLHQVKVRCSFDKDRFFSQFSEDVSFRLVPGKVRDIFVNASATTESSLAFYWTAPDGELDRFTVYLECKSPNKKKQRTTRRRGVTDDVIENIISYSYITSNTTITQVGLDPGTSCIANVTSHMGEMTGHPVVEELSQTTKESAPERVQDLQIKKFNSTALTITWSIPDIPNGVIRRYLVDITATDCTCCAPHRAILECYLQRGDTSQKSCTDTYPGLSGKPNLTVWCTDENVRYEATGLNPGRNYGVSIAAYTMCWGPPATIQQTTKETEPSSPPTIIEASATDQGVLVRWHPPACEGANGRITHYVVKHNVFTERCIGENQGGSTSQDKIFITTETSVNVTDLMAHKEYRIEVAAATSVGTGPYSKYRSVTTKESIPGAVDPWTINAYYINVNNFSVAWSTPCYTNGNITGYIVRIYNIDTNSLVNETYSSHRQMLVSNLMPYSNYTVSVAAVNTAGQGPYTNSTNVTTKVAAPYPVDHLKPLDVQPTSLKIGWKKPSLYTGPTKYNITVDDLYSKTSTLTVVYGFHNEEYTVSKLKPFWNYTVSIATITSAGVSETKHMSTTTSEDFPGPVQSVRATSTDNILQPRSVTVTWEALDVGQRNGVLQRYHVRHAVSGKNKGHITVSPAENILTIYNVATGQVEIQVTAETTPGEGQPVNTSVNVPVGAPLKIDESKQMLMTPSDASVSDKLTQIAVQLPVQQFLCNHSNGQTVSWGVIVAEASRAKDEPFFGMKTDFEKRRYKTWFDFRDTGVAEPYIATDQKWNPCVHKSQNNDRRRRSVPENEQSVFLVGVEGECSGKLPPDVCNGQLKHGQEYRVRSFACTSAGCTETEYSQPIKTDKIKDPEASNIMPFVIAGIGSFIVVLVVVVAVMFKTKKGCFSQEGPASSYTTKPLVVNQSNEMEEMSPKKESPFNPGPVNLVDFPSYVATMHQDSGLLFAEAYKMINENSPAYSTSVAEMQACRPKNRYTNILAFDHSRVKLLPLDDVEGSDYINASYIPGYTSRRAYIATQGPMTATFDDFWRMVWEQNVDTIVMLTKLVEKGRGKCDKYWPDLGEPVYYGDLVASTQSESNLSDYTIRIIELKLKSAIRTVRQFCFLIWPDMGCPQFPADLLSFVKNVRNSQPTGQRTSGPTLVHCSAGVGRTGTFIAVDHLLQHIRDQDDIDIYSIVLEMRRHRCKMVQTEDQYVYIHECLKEFITTDDNDQDDDSDEHLYGNTMEEEHVYGNTHFT